MLHLASDRNLAVKVITDEANEQPPVIGLVVSSEGDTVEITILSPSGERCGTSYVNGSEILRVYVDAEEDRALALISTTAAKGGRQVRRLTPADR